MKTSLLETVIEGLQSQKGDWLVVAKNSGVPYHTIAKIARRTTSNPGVLTVQKLADCLSEKRVAA
jgi:hypothetical protein